MSRNKTNGPDKMSKSVMPNHREGIAASSIVFWASASWTYFFLGVQLGLLAPPVKRWFILFIVGSVLAVLKYYQRLRSCFENPSLRRQFISRSFLYAVSGVAAGAILAIVGWLL